MPVTDVIKRSSRAESEGFVARLALEILARADSTQRMRAAGRDRHGLTDFDRATRGAVAVAGANRDRRWASGRTNRRRGWRRRRVGRLSPTRAGGEGQGERGCSNVDSHETSLNGSPA